MKTCSKCDVKKEFKYFNKFVRSKDGYRSDCRECQKLKRKEYDIEYKEKNPENFKNSKKKYKDSNRDKLKSDGLAYYYKNKERDKENKLEYGKKYREDNKEKLKLYRSEYYLNNKEYLSNKKKTYRENNKDRINEYQRFYLSKRLKNDIIFKISHYYRSMIRKSFNRGGFNKKSKTFEILGCSFEEFKLHLEINFEDWMTWENRGLYNGQSNYGWDIDHIIPISSSETEEDVIRLNHYTNLQPLCSHINRDIKRDSI
jgi:hypothetical protein